MLEDYTPGSRLLLNALYNLTQIHIRRLADPSVIIYAKPAMAAVTRHRYRYRFEIQRLASSGNRVGMLI